MGFTAINVEVEGPLAILTLNREKALNAINASMLKELAEAILGFEKNKELRAVVLTGQGKAFAAGADIVSMQSMGALQALEFSKLGGQVGVLIESSRLIYIAAVNGFALGGGCELAMCCDFIYASEKAKFGQPEVKLGVVPGFGGTQRLSRRVGRAKATELCVGGDMIKADEALRIGLCEKTFSAEELLSSSKAMAMTISKNGPLAVAEAKQLVAKGFHQSLDDAMRMEQLSFASLFDSKDQKEGMKAFTEKRNAAFTST